MEFQVPQFIAREATVITGLTFRQFFTLAAAGLAVFLLFFALRNLLFLFVIAAVFVIAFAIIFAFGQIQGQAIPLVFQNFVSYLFKPRVYVWRRKGMPESPIIAQPKIIISEPGPEEGEEKRKIEVTKAGQLGKLWRKIETR